VKRSELSNTKSLDDFFRSSVFLLCFFEEDSEESEADDLKEEVHWMGIFGKYLDH